MPTKQKKEMYAPTAAMTTVAVLFSVLAFAVEGGAYNIASAEESSSPATIINEGRQQQDDRMKVQPRNDQQDLRVEVEQNAQHDANSEAVKVGDPNQVRCHIEIEFIPEEKGSGQFSDVPVGEAEPTAIPIEQNAENDVKSEIVLADGPAQEDSHGGKISPAPQPCGD